jgi:hypothetical protein
MIAIARRWALALPGLILAGCATRSADVAPQATDPAQFAALSCEAMDDEADRIRQLATRLAYAVDERFGNNIISLSLGVTVFWPALLAMRPQGADAVALAQLKGRDDALRTAQAARACPPPPEALAPNRAAALPIALGERLVYEERPLTRGPSRQLGLNLQALRRNALEFSAQGSDPGQAFLWLQDPWGNQPDMVKGSGWLHWQRLLRADMALGDVLAGEVFGGESGLGGRLRGQVVAVGVQTSLGRSFDAAVIELYGDAPLAEHGTRLDGVMVVDRKSGVLLRLELRSGNPEFSLRRVLLRVEASPAP